MRFFTPFIPIIDEPGTRKVRSSLLMLTGLSTGFPDRAITAAKRRPLSPAGLPDLTTASPSTPGALRVSGHYYTVCLP